MSPFSIYISTQLLIGYDYIEEENLYISSEWIINCVQFVNITTRIANLRFPWPIKERVIAQRGDKCVWFVRLRVPVEGTCTQSLSYE